MKKYIEAINGYKVYTTLAVAAVIFSLKFWDVIDVRMYEYLMYMDSLLIAGSVRSALKKME